MDTNKKDSEWLELLINDNKILQNRKKHLLCDICKLDFNNEFEFFVHVKCYHLGKCKIKCENLDDQNLCSTDVNTSKKSFFESHDDSKAYDNKMDSLLNNDEMNLKIEDTFSIAENSSICELINAKVNDKEICLSNKSNLSKKCSDTSVRLHSQTISGSETKLSNSKSSDSITFASSAKVELINLEFESEMSDDEFDTNFEDISKLEIGIEDNSKAESQPSLNKKVKETLMKDVVQIELGKEDARRLAILNQEIAFMKDPLCKCKFCNYIAHSKSRLYMHIKALHLKIKDHKCRQCSYVGISLNDIGRHIKEVHHKHNRYKCSNCEYKTTRFSNLKGHLDRVHYNIRPYQCRKCKYKAKTKSDLLKHTRIHDRVIKKQN